MIVLKLSEDLKDAFDEFVELVKTEGHGVVHIEHVEGSIDLLVDRAAAHKRETVRDFFTI